MDDGRGHSRRPHLAMLARLPHHDLVVRRAANVALLQFTGCGTDSSAVLKYKFAVRLRNGILYSSRLKNLP